MTKSELTERINDLACKLEDCESSLLQVRTNTRLWRKRYFDLLRQSKRDARRLRVFLEDEQGAAK